MIERFVDSVLPAFIGGHRDPEFGPILLFGLGGSLAEAYGDIAYARCPLDESRLDVLLHGTPFAQALGKFPAAACATGDCLMKLSAWFAADPTLVSFDLNPVLVRGDGSIVAVDARLERST